MYKLPSHVAIRTYDPASPTIQPVKSKKRDLFRAYVAAVYLKDGGGHGGNIITSEWIKGILEYDEEDKSSESESEDSSSEDEMGKGSNTKDGDELSGMLNALLIPRSGVPKRKPASQLPPASTNVQTLNSRNFLSILNEKATQRRVQLSWVDNSSGPDHAKTWTSKLIGTLLRIVSV
jgi:hypothetical protein